ncbi:uncharacterized protein J3D65DRAFT_322535 [Phyllosticta citribraziliensis]|uniref:DNA2/NAM7 helicase helicase domain-containing protein n=1 Tax=Phyllosticta citribraziliensis TaxID=989973 RepID=A0ABR1LT09_9PEZI
MARRAPRRPPFLRSPMAEALHDFAAAKECGAAYAGTVPSPHADKRVEDVEHSHGQLMWDISGFVETSRSEKFSKERFLNFRHLYPIFEQDFVFTPKESTDFTAAQLDLAKAALLEADVIVATVARASDPTLYEVVKPHLILTDEAARATDSEIWPVFVNYPKDPKLMVGDSKQLRPVSHFDNRHRDKRHLALMTRLMILGDPCLSFINQHRCVKEIAKCLLGVVVREAHQEPRPRKLPRRLAFA